MHRLTIPLSWIIRQFALEKLICTVGYLFFAMTEKCIINEVKITWTLLEDHENVQTTIGEVHLVHCARPNGQIYKGVIFFMVYALWMKSCTSKSQSRSSNAVTFGIEAHSLPASTVPAIEYAKCNTWEFNKDFFCFRCMARAW